MAVGQTKTMIKFFHTADTHFGVENYGKVDSKTGIHSRFLDFVKSFERCVDLAIEQQVDLFLFCGDAYKTAYPTPTQQKYFLQLLFKLQQAHIPIVIIVGNHDHPLSFGKSHALDVFSTVPLDNMYVVSKPNSFVVKTKNGPVQIVGIPWPMRHNLVTKQEHRFKDPREIASYISEKVGAIITNFAQKLDPNIPAILAAHLTVSTGLFSGSEKCAVFGSDPIFLPSQLAIEPFDYVALGHLHRHQNLNPKGYPAVVYSGSTERIDFGERKEQKGFCSVTIDEKKEPKKRCSYEFITLPTRPMIQVEVELDAEQNQTKQILAALAKHNLTDAIIKIKYHLPENTSDSVELFEVERACAAASCIASINPIQKQTTRQQRAELSVAMDFGSLIKKYIEFKGDEIGVDATRLEKKAFELHQELEESLK